MATKFVELKDGVMVEIDSPQDIGEELHASDAMRVNASMETIGIKVSRILCPLGDAFNGLQNMLDQPIALDAAEVEVGLSFSKEGKLFIAKSKAEGAFKVKVTFKPTGSL